MILKGFFMSLTPLLMCIIYVNSLTVIDEEIKNSTEFTLDWYQSSFDEKVNTITSPISIRILLSLLYQSTVGNSEIELQDYVYLGDKNLTTVSQHLILDKFNVNPSIKIFNNIYVKKNSEFTDEFIIKAKEYKSILEQKDFTKKQETSDEINKFVEEKTNGLIKNLVTPDIFSDETVLFLLNTLYFKSNWETQFTEYSVTENPFNGIDGEIYTIETMKATGYYKTYDYKEINSSILELPYVTESNSKFWLILPNKNSDITQVKDLLTTEILNEIERKLNGKLLDIIIPKFTIENGIPAVPILRTLGINSIFDKFEVKACKDDNNLKVTDIRQKTKIIVDTAGTEASASSYIVAESRSLQFSEGTFDVDRPFLFLIKCEQNIVFIGHYSKP